MREREKERRGCRVYTLAGIYTSDRLQGSYTRARALDRSDIPLGFFVRANRNTKKKNERTKQQQKKKKERRKGFLYIYTLRGFKRG